MDLEAAKRSAGEAAAALVEDGMTLGLGSGTTARWFIEAVGVRVTQGLQGTAGATSLASATLAAHHCIPLLELDARGVDLAVDGADTIDPDLRLVKGLGGALVRERIVAAAARRFVVVADETKLRPQLAGFIPVELLSFGWLHTMALLSQTGATFALRLDAAGEPLRSDNGNLIADGEFPPIADPEGLAARLDAIPGVVGHGMFLGMADLVIVSRADGTLTRLEPAHGGAAGVHPPPPLAPAPPPPPTTPGGDHMAEETQGDHSAEETLAWRVIKPGHRVLDRDGAELGTVARVLGDEGADIFRGVALHRGMLTGDVEVLADRIGVIAADHLHTSLSADEAQALPAPPGH